MNANATQLHNKLGNIIDNDDDPTIQLEIRIGIKTGPVGAGVVGTSCFL